MGTIIKNKIQYGGGGGSISTDNMPTEDMSEIVSPLPSVMSRRMKYSTDEQIVGEWIDGKPLYQKTIDTTITSGWNTINHSIVNIDTIFLCESFIQNSSGTARKIGGASSGTELFGAVNKTSIVIYNTDTDYTRAIVTIQYTKTTD